MEFRTPLQCGSHLWSVKKLVRFQWITVLCAVHCCEKQQLLSASSVNVAAVTAERLRKQLRRWAKSTVVISVRTIHAVVATTNVDWLVITRPAAFMTSPLESRTVERRSAFHARSVRIAVDIWRIGVRRPTVIRTVSRRLLSAQRSLARMTIKSSETLQVVHPANNLRK